MIDVSPDFCRQVRVRFLNSFIDEKQAAMTLLRLGLAEGFDKQRIVHREQIMSESNAVAEGYLEGLLVQLGQPRVCVALPVLCLKTAHPDPDLPIPCLEL